MRLAEPMDQASGLRRLFACEQAFRALGVLSTDARSGARATAALARALGRRGQRVLVLDEGRPPHDVGAALGLIARQGLIDAPARGLHAVARAAGDGVAVLAAPDGADLLATLPEHTLLALVEDWRAREEAPEWLVLNGADSSGERTTLAFTAGTRVLVLPAERARLADAYALMKRAHVDWSGESWLVMVDGAEAAAARALYGSLRDTAHRFIDVEPIFLAALPRRPGGVTMVDASLLESLAGELLARPLAEQVNFEQYWQRMWLFSRMRHQRATGRVAHGERRAHR